MRPREKAQMLGVESLSDSELLAILLSSGYKGVSSLQLAEEILQKVGGINGLMKLSMNEIMEFKGVGLARASLLVASLELVRRINYEEALSQDVIAGPQGLVRWLQSFIGMKEQEYFIVVFLDNKNRITGYRNLFRGLSDSVSVQSSLLFREALNCHASKLIIAHNHPSQSVKPSLDDLSVTNQLQKAGELMNLPVIDHIIVSQHDYFSFRENNRI
ncbi:MAG: DNA repair protein RadC [Erysipelotrichaceae bacterium]|nr:DNA repair protein RadC [Erysipelotrichaceae bacterium]